MNQSDIRREGRISSPLMKIAMPSCLSARAVETVFSLASTRIESQARFKLLLDMSEVHQIEQDGLNRLYEMTLLMKDSGYSKIVIRTPNRVMRDALILSNTIGLFEIVEND